MEPTERRLKSLRLLLLGSLVINLLLVSAFVFKRFYSAPALLEKQRKFADSLRKDSVSYAVLRSEVWPGSRAEFFAEMKIDTGDVVFVGSSLTEDFPLTELFADLKIKNRGIDGNTSEEILHRIESVVRFHPKKIFIETGINDLNNAIPAESVSLNVFKIIEVVKALSPSTTIYIQSLLPVSGVSKNKNTEILKCNALLKKMCEEEKVNFINLHAPFVKNGEMNDSLSWDGVHLNGEGYLLWKNSVEKFVSE